MRLSRGFAAGAVPTRMEEGQIMTGYGKAVRVGTLCAFVAAASAACASDAPLAPLDAVDPAAAPPAAPAGMYGGEEELFLMIAAELPGFGGFFVAEDGTPSMYMKEGSAASARGAATGVAAALRTVGHDVAGAADAIRVLPGRFSFLELHEWRERAGAMLLATPGVVFLDLDEAANRITLGISEPGARAEATDHARAAGVPAEALRFVDAEPFRRHQTLQNYQRPLEGGYIITTYQRKCTLGFNAIWNGLRTFLTASHCTDAFLAPDAGPFFQNGPPFHVGNEVADPPTFPCTWAPNCRYSDAAVVRVIPGEPQFFFGIARTLGIGSIVVAPQPRFHVVSKQMVTPVGTEVHKMGMGTGWTRGIVQHSCVIMAVAPPGTVLLCQHLADYPSGGGDSGAPVFFPNVPASTADLHGLHWGQSGNLSVFSAMRAIEADFGVLTVF
jgi:hypothetical protein